MEKVSENARRAAVMVGDLVADVASRAAPEGVFCITIGWEWAEPDEATSAWGA